MITRDNYEEFFLLYVDNELSMAEKRVVEIFIDENPDLREEWEALLQCRVDPEPQVTFPGRDWLPGQDQEYLLSYIDNELNEEDRRAVESYIHRYPSRAAELELLRKTISHPDPAVVFADKEILHRAGDRRRIIFLRWTAAAAVVAGIVAFLIFNNPPKRLPAPLASKPAVQKNTLAVTPATPDTFYTTKPVKTQPVQIESIRKKDRVQELARTTSVPRSIPKTIPLKKDTIATGFNPEPANTVAVIDPPEVRDRVKRQARVQLADHVEGAMPGMVQEEIPREQSSFATQALLASTNDPGDEGPATGQDPPRKNKLRGLFRKVSRAFGKTADRDEDGNRKVLIGAFQFAVN